MNFETILPPTVIVAVVIFFIKEAIELIRKFRARRRKIKAYKKILAEELERNYWTWKSLRSSIVGLQRYRARHPGFSHQVVVAASGAQRLETRDEEGTLSSGSNLPSSSRSSFERILVGLAEEDENLYSLASDAYDEITEIAHVRASLMNEITEEDSSHLDTFLEYAVETLDSAINPIRSLYSKCTGKNLEQYKLR